MTSGAFRAAGLPVPEDVRQHNAYQLSQRQGWPWSPAIDEHVRRRGGELLGGDRFVCVDLDQQLAVDGSIWLDGFRWLTDAGIAAGVLLDITTCIAVRTPGNPDRAHGPGWHLWFGSDPGRPIRTGVLRQCRVVEIKTRCTSPGSPGYVVRHAPDELPVLPRWIAELAGAPPAAAAARHGSGSTARVWNRLHGIVERLLGAEHGERNRLLYWASARAGELVAAGVLETAAAEKVLRDAAAEIGLLTEDGESAVAATIASGMRQGAIA